MLSYLSTRGDSGRGTTSGGTSSSALAFRSPMGHTDGIAQASTACDRYCVTRKRTKPTNKKQVLRHTKVTNKYCVTRGITMSLLPSGVWEGRQVRRIGISGVKREQLCVRSCHIMSGHRMSHYYRQFMAHEISNMPHVIYRLSHLSHRC